MSLISGNESKIFAKGVIGNVRKAQEDSHGYKLGTPNGDLFVVCDGMGGHVGGATASRIAVDSIISHIDKEQYATPVEALNGALQFANMQILGHADAHPELKGMGTTACIVLIQNDGVWIAHVGDSRIYLYLGKEKQLHRITKDHSYVQTLVDAGEITDEEAEHHPNKNRIMKALGIKPELQPSFNFENRPIHPKNGDVFLICSDGLSGMIPDRTIQRVLAEDNLSLHQKGERLIELAMQGETVCPGGQDNCTAELIEVDASPWNESEFKSYNPVAPVSDESTIKEAPATTQPPIADTVHNSPEANTANNNSTPKVGNPTTHKLSPKIIAAVVVALLVLGGVVGLLMSRNKVTLEDVNKAKAALDESSKIVDSLTTKLQEIEEKKNETTKDLEKLTRKQDKTELDLKAIDALEKDTSRMGTQYIDKADDLKKAEQAQADNEARYNKLNNKLKKSLTKQK